MRLAVHSFYGHSIGKFDSQTPQIQIVFRWSITSSNPMIGRPCSKIAVAAPLLPMISKGVVEIPISLSCNSFEIELLVSSPLSEKTKFKSLENFWILFNPSEFLLKTNYPYMNFLFQQFRNLF